MTKRLFIGRLPNSAREEDVKRFFKNSGSIHDISLKNGYGFVEFDDDRDADDAVYDLNGKSLCGERIVLEHARGPNRGRDRDRGYGGSRGYDRDRGGGGGGGGYDRDRGGYDRDMGGYDKGYSSRSSSSRQPGWIDKYGPPTRTDHRVTVENLSSRVSWQDLKDYMRQAGEVTYADAHKDRKNEGVVEFASRTDMKNAISKLDNTEINGRHIRIVEESRSSRRSYSRSRSRSRSPRDRSKSASRGKSASRSRSRSASRSNSRSRSRSKDD